MLSVFRRHGDALFAGLFAAFWLSGVVGGDVPEGASDVTVFIVCGLLVTVPFAWRRRVPAATALVVWSAGTVLALLSTADLPIGFVLACLVAGYSLAAYAVRWRAWLALAVGLTALSIANVRHNDAGAAGLILTPIVFLVAPWAVGRLVTRLRAERSALRRLTLRLEREQRDVARASVLEERARIARELHDIVAHSISVMVVQAGAAEQFVDAGSRARAPLAAIRTTGQQALVEMRHLLGILRADDPTGLTLAPQPGLGNLEQLLETARGSGLALTVREQGEPSPLPPGIDVAAYRLVQESLSNIRKHACARSACLSLRYATSCLTIEITDDGDGGRSRTGQPGHGLIGMRERVALYGGRLECGPRGEGGWRVWAQLPLGT